MMSDSITNASATSAPKSRDFVKKRRTNRSAKLKQCKLDARREQWLSQAAKEKGCKEMNGDWKSLRGNLDEKDRPIVNLDMGRRDEDDGGTIPHECDMESPTGSPTSILGVTGSSPNFSGSSGRSSSSSCCGNITEEEEGEGDGDGDGDGDDGCLDDWEAFADALAAKDEHENHNPNPPFELCNEHEPVVQLASPRDSSNGFGSENRSGIGVNKANQDCPSLGSRMPGNGRAWRPDDEFRPQSLPNLSKQRSLPATDRRFGSMAVPAPCPICYEDLDLTDTNFLPCACGFRLCLFCHKRICDGDGRCPGCRKPYDQTAIKAEASVHGSSLRLRLPRSCSMGYRT